MPVRQSDEYWGTIAGTMDLPLVEVAELTGKTAEQIKYARRSVRTGRLPQGAGGWSDDELELIRMAPHLTASQLADRLPGRSMQAVKKKRTEMGAASSAGGGHKNNPASVGRRTLLAKSCTTCGLVLPGAWFPWRSGPRTWASECRSCNALRNSAAIAEGRRENGNRGNIRRQTVTLSDISRKGVAYTSEDMTVLSNPDLTTLQKALLLRRTYYGTTCAVSRFGFSSEPQHVGDPERDQWIIDNPNSARLEEIAEMMAKGNRERRDTP